MAELIDGSALKAAHRVITNLNTLQEIDEQNITITREIEHFLSSLNEIIERLQKQLPKKRGSSAFESFETDLNKAACYLEDNLQNGNFQKLWNAKHTNYKLERLRQDLNNKFQLKLFITTLEVVFHADQKMEKFESRMLELLELWGTESEVAMNRIRKLIQPLVVGMRSEDQRIQIVSSMIQGNEDTIETSIETQKFLADVVANIEDLTEDGSEARQMRRDNRDEYLDPITKELMNDPVKCTDGKTYDRFAVFEYNLTQKRPLIIVCDDHYLRRKLFDKFSIDSGEKKCSSLRQTYRDEALRFGRKCPNAEALTMVTNVLQWAPEDAECLELTDKLEQVVYLQERLLVPYTGCPIMAPPEHVRAGQHRSLPRHKPSKQQHAELHKLDSFVIKLAIMYATNGIYAPLVFVAALKNLYLGRAITVGVAKFTRHLNGFSIVCNIPGGGHF